MSIVLKFPSNPRTRPVTLPASTTFSADSAVTNGSGSITAAINSTIRIMGILQLAIAATDSDYATSGKKKNILIDEDGEWLCTTVGTAVAADEQLYVDFSDSVTIDRAATTTDTFFVTRFVSTVLLIGIFTSWSHRYSPAAD